MVYLTLGGGLGNQMFQYAFARKLQKLTGDSQLILSGYHLKNTVNSEHMLFQLHIDESVRLCTNQEQQRLEQVQNEQIRKLHNYRKVGKFIPGFSGRKILDMSQKGFYTTLSPYEKQRFHVADTADKYVWGGYQTWKYWDDISEQMRAELKVKLPASESNQAYAKEMENCESVCVHIRRGDYLAPEFAHLNVCDEKYYKDAMRRMIAQKPNAVFYIFTNNHTEITWLKEHYDFENYDVRYVDLDNPDYEELRLMYHCKNFIISNSTYSWWGQFLCENNDKIVMAPSVWNRQLAADGIYMPNWQIIQVK